MAEATTKDLLNAAQWAEQVNWKEVVKALELIGDSPLDKALLTVMPFIPVVGLGLTAAAIAIPVLIFAAQHYEGGDPDPIHDAQTTRNYNPGDPAARL